LDFPAWTVQPSRGVKTIAGVNQKISGNVVDVSPGEALLSPGACDA
jgi:hypothetical protein